MSNLNKHIKGDKAKWIITGIVLVLILVVLGGVVAMLFVERGGDDSTTSAAERTFCLDFTSIDEMVGYEYDDESDWFLYLKDEEQNSFSAVSLISVDMLSPTFDNDGMKEILLNTESVTVMLNGEEVEFMLSESIESQYLFKNFDDSVRLVFVVNGPALEFGDLYTYSVSGVMLEGEGTLENFKIISFNLAEEVEQGAEEVDAAV